MADTFLNPGMFNDVYEPKSMPDGEYQLRITAVETKHSDKTGGDFIQLTLDIPSEPKSKNIYHVMMFPTMQDDEKKRNNRLRAIQNMVACFGANITENFNIKSLVGNLGWAILREEEDPEYGTKNSIKKFVLPKA